MSGNDLLLIGKGRKWIRIVEYNQHAAMDLARESIDINDAVADSLRVR
jgi:hypothetical protein